MRGQAPPSLPSRKQIDLWRGLPRVGASVSGGATCRRALDSTGGFRGRDPPVGLHTQSCRQAIERAERDRALAVEIAEHRGALDSRVPSGRDQAKRLEMFPFTLLGLRALHAATKDASPDQGDLALILGLTGLRWGELVALRVRDVQASPYTGFRVSRSAPDGQPIRTTTKGGSARSVPLPAEVWQIVSPLLRDRPPNELLFRSPEGGRLNGPNWKRAVDWAKHCDGRRVHDLRHTAATLWLTNGIDPKTVQAWLGHSSATLTLDTYSHWIGTDGDALAVTRIDHLLGAAAPSHRHHERPEHGPSF